MSKVIRCKYRDEKGSIYEKDIPIAEETTVITGDLFPEKESLLRVTIPEGIKEIAESAFSGCRSLKCIEISENTSYFAYSLDTHTKVVRL